METPIFVSEDAAEIVAELKADLEANTGRVISDADIEMELITVFAYREKLLRVMQNDTARQCLLAFASGVALDALAQLVGVTRLPAVGAVCTIEFTLVAAAPALTLPANIRIQSTDGKAVFITTEPCLVSAGAGSAQVGALCTTDGIAGNGYLPGSISVILDPQSYLTAAINVDTSQGGADIERDDELRTRVELAPNSFSVAGPKEAYVFFAKSANQSIVSVTVKSTTPGTVNIYPLLSGGIVPGSEILDQVAAVCNDEKVRPLSDTVVVSAPTKIEYSIEAKLTLYKGALDEQVLNTAQANINAFVAQNLNSMGKDIVRTQIMGLCMVQGQVYNIDIVAPAADIVVDDNEFASCTGVSITVQGYNEG